MNNSSADPILMYLVINTSLNMSVGKTAVQVGHCVQMIMTEYHEYEAIAEGGNFLTSKQERQVNVMTEWLNNGSYGKIVLAADELEWLKLKLDMKDDIFLVRDNGMTELSPGSETVIGFFPMHKSQRPKIIKRLQLLND